MTMEFTAARSPLPGSPKPYFLADGEGEKAILIDSLFTVLLSADETGGQFGVFTMDGPKGDAIPPHSHADTHEVFYVVEGKVRVYVQGSDGQKNAQLLAPGDFGFVPAGLVHAYRVEEQARVLGVLSGGFERFFQHMGTPVDSTAPGQPPFVPDLDRIMAAGQRHKTTFLPGFTWPDAGEEGPR